MIAFWALSSFHSLKQIWRLDTTILLLLILVLAFWAFYLAFLLLFFLFLLFILIQDAFLILKLNGNFSWLVLLLLVANNYCFLLAGCWRIFCFNNFRILVFFMHFLSFGLITCLSKEIWVKVLAITLLILTLSNWRLCIELCNINGWIVAGILILCFLRGTILMRFLLGYLL